LVMSLGKDDVEKLIVGTTILGTGGGGNPKEGWAMLLDDLESGRKLLLSDPDEVDAESIVAGAYLCGSIAAPTRGRARAKNRDLIKRPQAHMTTVLSVAEKILGAKVSCIIPTELGGGNTAIALHLASVLGVSALDADQCGRSVPELIQSSYQINRVEAYPSFVADSSGNIIVIERYSSVEQYEAIVRGLAVASGGSLFVLDSAVKNETAKKVAITRTVTKAMQYGDCVIQANKKGKNPINEFLRVSDGFELFRGGVSSFKLEETGGFLVGETTFRGDGPWKGHGFRIWVKNENLVAWKDGKVVATCPDPIIVVDRKGYGVPNSELKRGLRVSIIGVKAEPIWRTERGLEIFGPKHFGFRFDYKPIEQLA
jgi:DUF917 family protein